MFIFGFSLKSVIYSILITAVNIWNELTELLFETLTVNPLVWNFKGSTFGSVVTGIASTLIPVGSTLMVLLFLINFCADSVDIREEVRLETVIKLGIKIGVGNAFCVYCMQIVTTILSMCVALTVLINGNIPTTRSSSAQIDTSAAIDRLNKEWKEYNDARIALGNSLEDEYKVLQAENPDTVKNFSTPQSYRDANPVYQSYKQQQADIQSQINNLRNGGYYSSGSTISISLSNVTAGIEGLDFGGEIAMVMVAIIAALCIIGSAAGLFFLGVSRMFKILCAIPFAPLAFASLGGGHAIHFEGTSTWIKSIIGMMLEACGICIALGLCSYMMANGILSSSANSGSFIGLATIVLDKAIGCILCLALAKTCQSIAGRVMGLGGT